MGSVRLVLLSLLLLVFGVQTALADVTAKYKISGGSYQIVKYHDADHVRSEFWTSKDSATIMVKNGGKFYLLNGSQVIDMTASLAAMRSMMTGKMAGMMGGNKAETASFEPTGRTETVAGIKGDVYQVKLKGNTHETVLAENATLYQVALGMEAVMNGMLGDTVTQRLIRQMNHDSSKKGVALLRYDHEFVLESVTEGPIAAAEFAVAQ